MGYTPPPQTINALDNKYYCSKAPPPVVHSNCSIHIAPRDPVTYACAVRGPAHYVAPLIPPTDKRWPWNTPQNKIPRINKYSEPLIAEQIDQHRTFNEWKNAQTYEGFYPDLFDQPHKVYPGKLFGSACGSFDWWKSQPEFDWWNVTNNQRDSWFRQHRVNARGDAVGERNPIPSRELIRIPSCQRISRPRSKSEVDAERAKQSRIPIFADKTVAKGFTPLIQKYVPTIPRFPLLLNEKNQLMSSFGPFIPLTTARGQVPTGFITTGALTPSTGRSSGSSSGRISDRSGGSARHGRGVSC